MSMDSYKIGLGNSDTATRKNAELDSVSFWNDEAKNFHGLNHGQKLLNGMHHLLNGSLTVRSMHPITHLIYIKIE